MTMAEQKPSVGRIVHYTVSGCDAFSINKRRRDAHNLNAAGVTLASQELGPQIHVGNDVVEGDVLAAVIVRVNDTDSGSCNLQVLLDGNDVFWATSRAWDNPDIAAQRYSPYPGYPGPGYQGGTWHWPERV